MFEKKTVYHSALVREGTIEVVITSDVIKSQYKDKPPFVAFTVNGKEHQYSTENAECEDALRGLKGHRVQLTASGRGDDATIDIVDDGMDRASGSNVSRSSDRGNSRNDRQEPRNDQRNERRDSGRQEQRRDQPQESREELQAKALKAAKLLAMRRGVLWRICHHVAIDIINDDDSGLSIEHDLRELATHLSIALERDIDINALPYRYPQSHPQQEPERRERQPETSSRPPDETRTMQRRQQPPVDSALDVEADDIPF